MDRAWLCIIFANFFTFINAKSNSNALLNRNKQILEALPVIKSVIQEVIDNKNGVLNIDGGLMHLSQEQLNAAKSSFSTVMHFLEEAILNQDKDRTKISRSKRNAEEDDFEQDFEILMRPHLENDEILKSKEQQISFPDMQQNRRCGNCVKSCTTQKQCLDVCIARYSSSLAACVNNECWCRPV